jgi:hypothetical protein
MKVNSRFTVYANSKNADRTVEQLKSSVEQLELSVKEQKKIYKLTYGLYIFTILLVIFTVFLIYETEATFFDEKQQKNEELLKEKQQRKEDLTRKKWDDFRQSFLGNNGQVFTEAVERNSTKKISNTQRIKCDLELVDIINHFGDMNKDFIRGDLDLELVRQYFPPYIYRVCNSIYVNEYIDSIAILNVRKSNHPDSLVAGSACDGPFLWAKRLGIQYDNKIIHVWEKFFYIDEASGEHFFNKDDKFHNKH